MQEEDQVDHPSFSAVLDENRRLKLLLQATQASGRLTLWERDHRSGVTHWGPGLFALLGLAPQAGPLALDQTYEMIDPRDRERVRREYSVSLERGGSHESRYRMRRPDGQVIHVHAIWVVVEGGGSVSGVIIDDTADQDRAGQTLQARQQLAMLSRIIGLFLWRRDYEQDRFILDDQVWLSPAEARTCPALTLSEFRALVHPDDLGSEISLDGAQSLGDTPVVAEIRFRRPGHGYRTMLTRRIVQRDSDGQAIGMLGVGVDVTDQVEARERHRRLLERFDLLVDKTGVGLWSWNLETDQQEWNDTMRALYGLAPQESLPVAPLDAARLSSEAVHEEDRERVSQALQSVLTTGAPRLDIQFRVRRPDGEVRVLSGRAHRLEGSPPMLCGIVLDVTESQRAAQALRDKEVAEEADRAKSAFLSRVSHELRTPLNAVLGFSELMLVDRIEPLGAMQRQRLELVQDAGRHLLGLVEDLLEIGRQGALPKLQNAGGGCELNTIVRQVLAWSDAAAQAAGVDVQLTGQVPAVVGGERHWRQIVTNLLSNAIKFNQQGGKVELALSSTGTPPWPQLTVIDNGRGLTEDQQRSLFEPFNRLGAERDGIPGTGLGLSLVRQLVQAMGGEIDVRSEPGVGTTVTVRAPPADAMPMHGAAPGPVPEPDAAASADEQSDVVYVEDNAVNFLLVHEILKRRPKVRLHGASTLAEALPLVRKIRPALLLVDMHLPDGNGLSLLKALDADGDRPARHCVALSADAMPEEIARARAGGFDDYWAKPIQIPSFLDGVDRLLATR